MTDYTELIQQLRDKPFCGWHSLQLEAADALEAQARELADAVETILAADVKIDEQAHEIEADKHNQQAFLKTLAEADAQIEALRADAERGRKLVDWLERYGLLKAEFCAPGIGAGCGNWWVLHKPYMIDGNGCEGYGKTEREAIDAALQASEGKP